MTLELAAVDVGRVCVVMPALNEATALPAALADRPDGLRVVVVDNGSIDMTASVARSLNAEVITEPRRGFGAACRRGLGAATGADVVVFMDADASCDWRDLPAVADPVLRGDADLVIGRRVPSLREPGALPAHVAAANAVIAATCRLLTGAGVHDLGPLRAVRRERLISLDLGELTYGWPLEMVLEAGRSGWRITEVPVRYHRRVGTSKVTGTVRGTLGATAAMAGVLWRHRRRRLG